MGCDDVITCGDDVTVLLTWWWCGQSIATLAWRLCRLWWRLLWRYMEGRETLVTMSLIRSRWGNR